MNSKKNQILVIGAGAWGIALAHQLAKKNQVIVWDRDISLIEHLRKNYYHPAFNGRKLSVNIQFINEIVSCENVLIATSSHGFTDVLNDTRWHKNAKNIAWATKGILTDDPYFLPLVFDHFTQNHSLRESFGAGVVISGPSFALEVIENQPTGISVASNDSHKASKWASMLHSEYFRPYRNDDPLGVSIFGALKNIYAIVCGINSALGFGANAEAFLITRSLKEINRFAKHFGAKSETVYSLAAVGDLILTCSDDLSRNRSFGYLLGQGHSAKEATQKLGKLVEGMNTLEPVYQLMKKNQIPMPILAAAYQLIFHQKSLDWVLEQLFSRSLKKD